MRNSNQPKIVYLLDNFPVLSETFIQQEALILEHQGLLLRLFSLSEPSASKSAEGAWHGQTPVTYISHQSKLNLLAIAVRRFLKTPGRFLRTGILTFVHDYPWSAIWCLLCGAYVSEKIEQQGITHLHAHFASRAASVAQVVYLLTGIPYSFTTHAYDIYLSRKSALAYKMGMARFVITVSAYNQQYLEKLVDQRIYLISACHILKNQGYDFICRIVGEGPQRRILEHKIRELALTDSVELLGAATHKQVIKMYQQATTVTLPCIVAKNGDRDGIPIALVEALYMGVPVVSTPVSGIPELISEEVNGLLVPPQDSRALAAALALLLDDPLLRCRLARAGRETVLERFDMAQNAQRLMRLFCADEEDRRNA